MSEMHRRGHTGMAMLAYAPVGHLFLQQRQFALAALGLIGVLLVEPLPDNDLWIPWFSHRGTSHSLLCALVVGGVLGTGGWILGELLGGLLARPVATLVSLPIQVDDSIVGELMGLFHRLNGPALASFGFAVGAFGIITHLLADIITIGGVRPFLPLSRWRLSLSSLRADSMPANNALFVLGVVALAGVLFATAPGVGFGGSGAAISSQPCPLLDTQPDAPDECVPSLDLSPVGVAAGQSANQSGATVTISNQSTNGSTVTIESAILPDGGFIALQSSSFVEGLESRDRTVIAVSKYLKPGNYTNLTIDVSNAPPGNYPGLNRSQLNESQTLAAVAYRDSNGNRQMDYVRSIGENDTAYTSNGNAVADTAGVTVPSSEKRQRASVSVRNQTLQGDSLVVESTTLPDGGFLVVHNESYLPPESAPLESAVGVTRYLEPGQHRGVGVPLLQGAVTKDQTLVVVPYRDTNSNQRYDYITSGGFRDTAYENRAGNQSVVINETVGVTVRGAERTSASAETSTETSATSTTTPVDTATPFRVTNLSVSNRSAHVGDEITVTAWVENPTDSRLESEVALATAGTAVETDQIALFPRERRAVRFTHSYDAPGRYVIKVAGHTEQIRIVEEGASLTSPTTNVATNADTNSSGAQAADAQSGGLSLTDILLLVVLLIVLGGLVWALITFRKRMG